MEDSASVKSNDSIATSEEYEFVNASCVGQLKNNQQKSNANGGPPPLLNIANNGDLEALRETLQEVLSEERMETMRPPKNNVDNSTNVPTSPTATLTTTTIKRVGQSLFYDVDQISTDIHDIGNDDGIEIVPDVQQDCTVFSGVSYLGAAAINAPKSELEIQRNMGILNSAQRPEQTIRASVSIPCSSEGVVTLYDATSGHEMARYEVQRILFYARGGTGTPEAACFAFTWSHGETQESAIFQCHVFRCHIPEAVGQVSACFAKAFQRIPSRSLTSSAASASDLGLSPAAPNNSISGTMTSSLTLLPPDPPGTTRVFVFEVTLEIKEEDGRGGYSAVPKDRSCFKLRCNLEKQLCLTVQQVSDNERELIVERCFGVLVSPGRHVRHGDMRLLEMGQGDESTGEGKLVVISGHWDPGDPALEALNVETPRDTRAYITVAVDLVVRGIQEPVRFVLEAPVKLYPSNERFWYITRRPLVQLFELNLKQTGSTELLGPQYEVLSIEARNPELDRTRLNLASLSLVNLIRSPSPPQFDLDSLTPGDDPVSDGDEPMLSGTGNVSKDCSAFELESWAEVLARWGTTRPRQLSSLVRAGVPEALRGEVWQRLAGCDQTPDIMDTYRVLLTKDSSCEAVIQRDMHRTFPAHEFFRDSLGQDALYRLSKAYAVYDTEVGYCQGLSFLSASLLLHMPEEQAFCVLVKLMYNYGLRDLYKDGFDNLYLRLYQLNRLLEEQIPALWLHLQARGVESHMFAAQWFLTVFTARFPLPLVFHILDVFLLQGLETLFQVALALLMMCKKDLVQLDFESILKYFRVSLPKRCRNEEVARQLMKLATSLKVKKLKKYAHEWAAVREAQAGRDRCTHEMEQLRSALGRCDEDRRRLEAEASQVKAMLQRELARHQAETATSQQIIADYKQICKRLDEEQVKTKTALNELRNAVSECSRCGPLANQSTDENNGIIPLADNSISSPQGQQKTNCSSPTGPSRAQERIRELELELAQTKLAHVEAECRNQDLVHQLSTTAAELQTTRNSWSPWLHKTLTSIKEVAVAKAPSTSSGIGNSNSNTVLSRRESSSSISTVEN